jgi:hypothetical protein
MAQRKDRKAYWQAKIHEYRKSGLTQREFCRRQNISYWSFNAWNRRLNVTTQETGLVEVHSRALISQHATSDSFEIVLPAGLTIRIPEHFRPETLCRIIETLGDGK